jgi:predicted nucleotidyltransferase
MQTDGQAKPIDENEPSLSDLLQEKREQILEIATRHGAYNVRIFGSAAKGTAGPASDLDLLVDVQPEHSAWFPAGLILDLEALLDREVDVVTKEALHWYIRDRVLAEAVPL